ncbi:hypothetical protein RB213_012801 [Colletotrichum asianum]
MPPWLKMPCCDGEYVVGNDQADVRAKVTDQWTKAGPRIARSRLSNPSSTYSSASHLLRLHRTEKTGAFEVIVGKKLVLAASAMA